MQRIFAILSIVVLLFMQGSPTISWAAETTKNNQDSFAVSAKEGSTQEKATVELKSLVSEHDKVHIKLPEDAAYDEEMTKELEQEAITFAYEKQDHSIEIEWVEEEEQDATLILVDLLKVDNELIIQGIVADEVITEETHTFKVAEIKVDINETEQEEVKAKEEQESKKEVKEEDKQESKKEVKEKDKQESKKEVQEEDKQESKEEVKEKEKQESEGKEEEKEKEKQKRKKEREEEDKQERKKEGKEKDKQENKKEVKEKDKQESKKEVKEEDKQESKKEVQEEAKQKKESKVQTKENELSEIGDLNTYLGIGPVFESALSGADADFRMTLKLTGSKRTYKNVDVVIDLPLTEHITFDDSEESLIHLAVDGVVPTFNSETNQLAYHFDEIKRGQMYEKIISLNTESGYIPEDTSIDIKASINGDIHYTENDEKEEAQKGDVVPFEYEDNGSMLITASGALSLSKFRVNESESEYPNASIVAAGEEVLWKLELEIPKKDRGQLFLNPDEKITITDILPAELDYVEVVSGDEPASIDNKTLSWEFDADDFENQAEKEKTLYTKNIVIKTKVTDNAEKGESINKAKASATFINDNQVTYEASRGVRVAIGDPSTGEIEGSVYRPSHLGPDPTNSNGLGDNQQKNPNPTVTDDTLLRFSHGLAPLQESFPDMRGANLGTAKNFIEYQTHYEIDPNLNLEEMRVPGPFQFRPNATYPAGDFFKEQPKYEIKAKIDDNGSFETLVSADEVIHGKIYTREELGLLPGQKVNEIKIEFTKGYMGNSNEVAPGGMLSTNTAQYEFSINEGFTGKVESNFNVTGINGNDEYFDDRFKNPDAYDNSKNSDISGPRQATVVAYGEGAKPVGRVGVKLLEDVRGVVTLGNNRMEIELANINNSGAPMNSQLETVVLLPPGVTLHDEVNPSYTNAQGDSADTASYENLEEDYNGSGRQLVQVKWDDSRITKEQNLTAELDVYISEHAPNQLMFDVYGFSSDDGLQAPSNTDGGITDTVLQTDTEDLNGNGDTSQPRLKSGNQYTLAGKYDIQTEKLIKGPHDDDYSKFTLAPFDGTVDYKLKLTNTTGKDLSIMTLIDVLPTVGDLGITDNINRGSMFDPILEGPIELPSEWHDKVNVSYSTVKNPERDDLTRHTDYLPNTQHLTNPEEAEAPNWISVSEVNDWSTIHSFKIELQKGDEWIKGQDIEIDFSMKMPTESDVEDEVKNLDLVPQQRAAWNSFAVATDVGQPVEPERVGVALELDPPETPGIEKEVEDNDGEFGKELVEKEREKDYKYNVKKVVPDNLAGYEALTLTDELDEKLDVIDAVALVDGEEVDYEVVIEDQLVTLKVDREQLDEISGQELTLQITAQIKARVEVEVIDNEAVINVNDNPGENSNIVPVIPPPETPGIEKEVEDNDGEFGKELVEKEREKDYKYNVKTVIPDNLAGYEALTLTDELDEKLDVIDAVALVDGEEVDYEVVIEDQLVTLKVDREQLDEISGQELTR